MIPDRETNAVFISGLLPGRHPRVAAALRAASSDRLRVIPGTRDVWCRDYMPVQLAPGRFVQFRYDPDYLRGDPHLRTKNAAGLLNLEHCQWSNLVLDGGNVVRWHETAIITDKVFEENPKLSEPQVRRELERLLEVERLVVIPREPGDVVGHADGVVRFVDRDTLLVNDYGGMGRRYERRLREALGRTASS